MRAAGTRTKRLRILLLLLLLQVLTNCGSQWQTTAVAHRNITLIFKAAPDPIAAASAHQLPRVPSPPLLLLMLPLLLPLLLMPLLLMSALTHCHVCPLLLCDCCHNRSSAGVASTHQPLN
jgi:hypothetical protein